jgi:hypothetical protein
MRIVAGCLIVAAAEIIFKREICPKVKNAFAVSELKGK